MTSIPLKLPSITAYAVAPVPTLSDMCILGGVIKS